MAEKLIVLTQKDLALIQRFLETARRAPVNTFGRGREGAIDHEELPAPEVYIARVPGTAGIPALTESVSHLNDIPGLAECDVYRINVESGTPYLRRAGFTRPIYNISPTAILQEDVPWIPTKRDKFGSWLADLYLPGSGGTVEGDVYNTYITNYYLAGSGTGTGSEDPCGFLILDCSEDAPGTGSSVTIPGTGTGTGTGPGASLPGHTSPCNDGEIVEDTLDLILYFNGLSVTVPLTYITSTTSCYGLEGWEFTGPTTEIAPGLEIVGAALCCGLAIGGTWSLELAVNIDGSGPIAYGQPFGIDYLTIESTRPVHWSTQSIAEITAGGNTDFLLVDIQTPA